jgi:ankyrin repeat protein
MLRKGHKTVSKMGIFDFSKKNVSPEELIDAAKNGNVEEMKLLLKKGANVSAATGRMALIFASINGHTEMVKLLLEKGAKIDGMESEMILMMVSENGHTEIVRLLKEKGVR